jgi:hypothetical protein
VWTVLVDGKLGSMSEDEQFDTEVEVRLERPRRWVRVAEGRTLRQALAGHVVIEFPEIQTITQDDSDK